MGYSWIKSGAIAAGCLIAVQCAQVHAQEVPAPGTSPRIDAIKKAGKLRVGVLTNPPFLVENTSGKGEAWGGPAWLLAKRAAKDLKVELEPVRVSHETKVPILNSNGVDISITTLAVSDARLKVIDFVLYARNADCLYGLASNKKLANIKNIDELNNPDIEIAFVMGAPEEQWLPTRFPKAKLRGVVTSSPSPIEEIMARRTDVTHIQNVQWPALQRKVKGLKVWPSENNCQDTKEKSVPIGVGIDKGQDVFKKWLEALVVNMKDELKASEIKMINEQ
jgi:polar amino acid transport system substrate-binding protein